MVRVLFAGPSLPGVRLDAAGIDIRPPAAQGDLQACVLEGANVVGLVDGVFETVAATWHKEILFALSQGVTVLGAASMGALRAAECHAFGMIPIGEIAQRYVSGALDDDAAVAQLHGPAELGYLRVTEALVDCEAAIAALGASSRIDAREACQLVDAARGLFFKQRTWHAVVDRAGLEGARGRELLALLPGKERQKQRDARRLVEAMQALPDARTLPDPGWHPARTPAWLRTLNRREAAP
ncbi:TfuA-like protein [Aureimonas sp. ME7]|uniref:TfuA-like protein n=1 Tax=Aureimonas sp. ME7 TaxID=2744252 RepID=UPI001FCEE2E6|nr:TfuA-like protein [Aureimonas sp. ME7]